MVRCFVQLVIHDQRRFPLLLREQPLKARDLLGVHVAILGRKLIASEDDHAALLRLVDGSADQIGAVATVRALETRLRTLVVDNEYSSPRPSEVGPDQVSHCMRFTGPRIA